MVRAVLLKLALSKRVAQTSGKLKKRNGKTKDYGILTIGNTLLSACSDQRVRKEQELAKPTGV
jgi:hypothetical protein